MVRTHSMLKAMTSIWVPLMLMMMNVERSARHPASHGNLLASYVIYMDYMILLMYLGGMCVLDWNYGIHNNNHTFLSLKNAYFGDYMWNDGAKNNESPIFIFQVFQMFPDISES